MEGVGVASFGDATKEGYIFKGWWNSSSAGVAATCTQITGIDSSATWDVVLYARWEEKVKYNIIYDTISGVDMIATPSPDYYYSGEGAKLSNPESFYAAKRGYTIVGWMEGLTEIDASQTGDVTIYPKVTQWRINIEIRNTDGDLVTKPNVDYNSKYIVPSGDSYVAWNILGTQYFTGQEINVKDIADSLNLEDGGTIPGTTVY